LHVPAGHAAVRRGLLVRLPRSRRAGARLLAKAIDEDKLIAEQPPGRCELCGAVAETRPYGPNGEDICFACGPGSGDPAAVAAAERAMARRLG
jgi:hypothetical protein